MTIAARCFAYAGVYVMTECGVVLVSTLVDAFFIYAQQLYIGRWHVRCFYAVCAFGEMKPTKSGQQVERHHDVSSDKIDSILLALLLFTNVTINVWFLSIW